MLQWETGIVLSKTWFYWLFFFVLNSYIFSSFNLNQISFIDNRCWMSIRKEKKLGEFRSKKLGMKRKLVQMNNLFNLINKHKFIECLRVLCMAKWKFLLYKTFQWCTIYVSAKIKLKPSPWRNPYQIHKIIYHLRLLFVDLQIFCSTQITFNICFSQYHL